MQEGSRALPGSPQRHDSPVPGVLSLLDSEHPSWPPQSSGGLALLPAQLLVCGLSAAVQEGWGLGQERASGRGLLGKDRV